MKDLLDQDDFTLGACRVQPRSRRISGAGQERLLEPRVMQTLVALASAAGEVVSRDSLMQQVWGHEHVTDDALNRHVSWLRRALSDLPGLTLETVPKVGYRLLAEPATEPAADPSVAELRTVAEVPAVAPSPPTRRRWQAGAALVAVLLVGVLIWSSAQVQSPAPLPQANRPLTALPGAESSAAISPDGSRVVFAWRPAADQPRQLQILALGEGGPQPLTEADGNDGSPAWSPDGSRIAFLRRDRDRCEVRVVAAVGGPSRLLTQCEPAADSTLDWSADGRWLLTVPAGQAPPTALHLVPVAGGKSVAITAPPAGAIGDAQGRLAPDGQQLAFVRWMAYGVGDLYVQPLAGGSARRITHDGLKIHGFDWSQDAQALIFSSNRGGSFGLWRVELESGQLSPVAGGGRHAEAPVVSRRDGRIVYEAWDDRAGLWRSAVDGSLQMLPVASSRWDWAPALSPDGQRLVFASDRSGSPELWLAERGAAQARRLTHHNGPYVSAPSWTADGQSVLYHVPNDSSYDIWRVPADGGQPQPLAEGPEQQRCPVASEDGQWLYFVAQHAGRWQVHRQALQAPDAQAEPLPGALGTTVRAVGDGSLIIGDRSRAGLWRWRDGDLQLLVPEVVPLDADSFDLRGDTLAYIRRDADGLRFEALDLQSGAVRALGSAEGVHFKGGIALDDADGVYFSRLDRRGADLMMLQP